MKRFIAPIITTLILGGVVSYIVILLAQGRLTLIADLQSNQIVVAIILIALLLAVLYYSTMGAYRLNKPKITLSMLGIIIILCGAYLVIDPRDATTYLSDMMRLTGVYVLIAALAGFIGKNLNEGGDGSVATRIKDAEVIEI